VELDRPIILENGGSIMLVLSRKCQEVVVVGGADGLNVLLKVTVLGIENGKVRLGFEAAEDVPVHRAEVWERIRAKALIGVPMDSLN
jgi:carbon storage regulator